MSQHRWDRDGERCLKCGDKDWLAGPLCHGSDTPRTDVLPVSDPMTEREAALFQHARTLERELYAAQARIAELEAENARLRKGLDEEGAPEQERDAVNVPRQKP